MPKIGHIELLYDGDNYHRHEIHYKQNQGFYIKGLSAEFKGLTGFNPEGYNTESAIVDEVEEACRLYRKLKTQAKIVILYKCEASTILRMNQVTSREFSGLLPGVSNKIQSTGSGSSIAVFGIDFEIAQLIDDGVKKKYYRVDPLTRVPTQWEVTTTNGYQEMEFSEERYLFFMNLVESMKRMVLSASKFFGVEPKIAELFIENKQRLLELSDR